MVDLHLSSLPHLCAVFLGLLKELQDGLELDGLTEELEAVNSALSESIRSAILGKHTHSPILSKVSNVTSLSGTLSQR